MMEFYLYLIAVAPLEKQRDASSNRFHTNFKKLKANHAEDVIFDQQKSRIENRRISKIPPTPFTKGRAFQVVSPHSFFSEFGNGLDMISVREHVHRLYLNRTV
jgi:hypothetical protein